MIETPNITPPLPPGVDLDAILTTEQAAQWLQISVKQLLREQKKIKPIRIGDKTFRYHPRTVIHNLTKDSPAESSK